MPPPPLREAFALVLLASSVLALLGAACGSGSEDPVSPSVVIPTSGTDGPSATASPSTAASTFPTTGENVSFHPPLTRSGIADVDAVLREVESADVAALLTRLRFSDVACAENPLGIGAPPKCPPGISSGTLVSVFPLDRCEEGFASLAEVEGQVRSAIARQPRLYAVHRPDRPGTGGAAFVAVFGFREEQPSGVFRVDLGGDGAIVRVGVCGLATLSLRNVGAVVLPPLP